MQPIVRSMLKIVALTVLLILTLSIGAGSLPQRVYASPLSAPPDISVASLCGGSGNATFVITNAGGDMTAAYTYQIFQESTLVKNGSFQLVAGDSVTLTTSDTYGNIRIDINDDASTLVASATTTCDHPTSTPTSTNTPTLVIIPPKLTIAANCDTGGNATFIITNTGGDMPVAYSYKVFEESAQVKAGSFQLTSGASVTVTTSGTFGNIHMEITDDKGSVTASEGTTCDHPTSTPTSTNTPTVVIVPPKLTIAANCDTGGNATFIITNSGGDMPAAYSYKVFEESTQVKAGSFKLTSGASASETTSGTFGNIHMEITDDKGSVIANQGTTCDHPTSTPTSTNTYTAVPTLAPTATPKPHSSGNNSVTSNNHYFWSGWLYTATRTPTITTTTTGTTTTTRSSTVTSTTNSIAEAASSTPVAFTVTPIQSASTPMAGTPMDGSTFLPWLGLGLILMGSFFSVIFFRQVQK